MVRTAATAIKTGGGKSTKGISTSGGTNRASSGTSSKRTTIGGNKPIERPIPQWQKPITNFFTGNPDFKKPAEVPQFLALNDSITSEDEAQTLEAPEWQKPVTMFLRNHSEHNIQQGTSSTAKSEEKKTEEFVEPNLKRKFDEDVDKNKENLNVYVSEVVEDNPAKRAKADINFKNLEDFENC